MRIAGSRKRDPAVCRPRPTLADLPDEVPRHLRHCHALGARDWWIWMWRKANDGTSATGGQGCKIRVPYRCNSWRCPACRTHEAHVAWTRIRDAFKPLDPAHCVLMVLTLDRLGTYSGSEQWENAQAAYRDLSKLSNDLMKRLRKWMKASGMDPLGNQWVATVEAHRSGWPHVNFLIWSPDLARWLDAERKAKLDDGISEHDARFVSRELADIVTAAGWGLLSTAERANSADAAAGYIVKVAGKADQSIGELAKMSQLPTNAPFRFRRIRSGKGFLPAREKSATLTGTLVRRQNSNDGTRDVIPLHDIKGDDVIPIAEYCCQNEERIWYSELETAHRCASQVKRFGMAAIELPPVTYWFRFQRLPQGPPRKAITHAPDDLSRPNPLVSNQTRAA